MTEQKILLGRASNNLQMGVVGLPNVGKTSFFNVITRSMAKAENYPFCTLDPNTGRVSLPDERFDFICEIQKPQNRLPAYLTITDIAGLIKGASEGKGLGNMFLSHVSAVDGLFHLVRCFDDPDVTHVEETIDPVRDIDIVASELRKKDEDFLSKNVQKHIDSFRNRKMDKRSEFELATKQKALELLVANKDVRFSEWTNNEIEVLNALNLLTAKPVVFLANHSEENYAQRKSKYIAKVRSYVQENFPGEVVIPFSASFESSYLEVPHESVKSALPTIIRTGYTIQNLISFFTMGPTEVRSWTVRKGAKAPQAGSVIHTDFEKKFIMAEVMHVSDLMEHKSVASVKAAAKYHQRGRDYEVVDGDIILFKVGGR